MRPQQNRRMGSRRSSNGASPHRAANPLTRNYESSGPEVKIRGNAQHIADKYLTLARDAQAAGDRVLGESYLQYAEHYTRIILSAQTGEQSSPAFGRAGNAAAAPAAGRSEDDSAPDRDEPDMMPQPVIDGLPGEVALMHRGGYKDAGGSRAEADEDSAGRAERGRQQRRRLPARRSNLAARRGGSPREEGAEQPMPGRSESAYAPRAAQAAAVRDSYGAKAAGGDAEETQKADRPRKPHRPKPAGNGEAELDI